MGSKIEVMIVAFNFIHRIIIIMSILNSIYVVKLIKARIRQLIKRIKIKNIRENNEIQDLDAGN